MLSRTADSLYWLARYVERAENVARIVLVGHRMASMARSLGASGDEWLSTLIATGCEPGFFAKYSEPSAGCGDRLPGARSRQCVERVLLPRDRAAQRARRAHRADRRYVGRAQRDLAQGARFCVASDDARYRAAVSRMGARALAALQRRLSITMLRNDAFYFTRLGTFLERADNTARILDVKYYVLLPQDEGVGGALDYYQWQSILRSVSALRAYHWVYHDRLQPWLIAELLVAPARDAALAAFVLRPDHALSRSHRRGLWRRSRRMPPSRRRSPCAAALRQDPEDLSARACTNS